MSLLDDLKSPLRTVLGFSLVINLALLAPSLFMLQVFDRVLSTGSVETLVMMALIAGSALALMGVLDYCRGRALAAIGIRIEQDHGPRLLEQMLTASARGGGRDYLDGMRDLAAVRAFLGGAGVVALCDAPWTVIYLLLIYLFDTSLGVLATLCTAFLLLLAWLNERATRGGIAQLHDASREAGRFVDDALRHAEVVTALGMPGAVAGRWERQNRRAHGLQLEISRLGGRVTSLSRVSRQLIQVLMLGAGAYLVIHEGATPGVMLATTIILARALAPVEMLIGGWKGLVDARAAVKRLREVLERRPEGLVLTELPRPDGRLAVEAVTFTPPGSERPLLKGVSLQAAPGQLLAVVGASGSGKTTLARLLVGVTQPGTGAVRLDGADIRGWAPGRLGAWIGYLPQDVGLFDGSIAENIARLGPIDSEAVLCAAQQAHAHEMILRLPEGYETRVGAAGARLSGGQRQRVALARALYGDPALVVLDEPDASLDAEGEQALLDALRGLKARGRTVVVISQRRAVLSVADSVIVMKDGLIDRIASVDPASGRTGIAATAARSADA
ncbi:MAG TPA: type I secretion system permease/ATPase [Methylibium sp.]|nr:type I secretion system permease/ATPase [Methylibium sp.]